MPSHGGMCPYPRRMGGGRPRVRLILDSLNAQRGTGYAVDESSNVYVENMAFARAIAVLWSTNQRLANQWIPRRMTDTLPRWEKILAIGRDPADALCERREKVQDVFSLLGLVAVRPTVTARLAAQLGPVFVAIEYISLANAVRTVPDASWPFGNVVANVPLSSSVLHVLVYCQKPEGYTEADFYRAVAKVPLTLDPIFSAWSTWDWYRAPSVYSAGINVAGGPSHGGFFLDEINLDNQVFDE